MTKMTTAQEQYIAAHAEAFGHINKIGELLGDMPAPDEHTNYAQVGDMGHIKTMLRDVIEFMEQNRQ
jgi:hypothetical protein